MRRSAALRADFSKEAPLKNPRRVTLWQPTLVALLLVLTMRAVGSSQTKNDAPRADCAFSNPAYSGWCRQSVPMPSGSTPQKACEAVLSCLNGNACQANYCNAPNIRSGWRLEEAKTSAKPR
jgi:hypothetical protein